MSIILDGTNGIVTPDIDSGVSTLGPLTQALNLGSTGQIVFPTTQNPSANANTMDDYEEGSWTPGYTSSQANFSYAARVGRYVKIGKVVTAYCFIACSSVSGSTGNPLSVFGLPYVHVNTSNLYASPTIGQIFNVSWPTDARQLIGYMVFNQSTIALYWVRNATTELAATAAQFGSNTGFMLSITYETTS